MSHFTPSSFLDPFHWHRLTVDRDTVSLQAIEYYSRLPQDVTVDRIFILDPMVATGNTAIAALRMMQEWGLKMDKVSFLGIIASQSAVDTITKAFPQVDVSCLKITRFRALTDITVLLRRDRSGVDGEGIRRARLWRCRRQVVQFSYEVAGTTVSPFRLGTRLHDACILYHPPWYGYLSPVVCSHR